MHALLSGNFHCGVIATQRTIAAERGLQAEVSVIQAAGTQVIHAANPPEAVVTQLSSYEQGHCAGAPGSTRQSLPIDLTE